MLTDDQNIFINSNLTYNVSDVQENNSKKNTDDEYEIGSSSDEPCDTTGRPDIREQNTLSGDDTNQSNENRVKHSIQKLREHFEKTNDKITNEIMRVNTDIVHDIVGDMSQSLNSQLPSHVEINDFQRIFKSKHSTSVKGNDDTRSYYDVESLAPSRKVKKKKIKKLLKRTTSNVSVGNYDKKSSEFANLQMSENKSIKKPTKVVHKKTIKRNSRRKNFENDSKEQQNEINSSSGNSQQSLTSHLDKTEYSFKYDSKDDGGGSKALKQSKSYVTTAIYNLNNDKTILPEKLHEGLPVQKSFVLSPKEKNCVEELFTKKLNSILRANNIQDDDANNDKEIFLGDEAVAQSSKYLYNYEMPTIASQMKKVNRTLFNNVSNKSLEKSNRVPFVVGTSVSTTNNLFLLKQQISSKIKTYLMSNINQQQLRGWNVNNLRLLILNIEKCGGVHRRKQDSRNRPLLEQIPVEQSTDHDYNDNDQ